MFFFSIAAVPMDMKCPGARRRCPRPPAPCPRRAVPRARGSHLHSKYMFAWTNWLRGSWWYPHRADVEAVAVRRIEEQFRFWYPRWLEAQASILPSHFMSFIFKKRNERTKWRRKRHEKWRPDPPPRLYFTVPRLQYMTFLWRYSRYVRCLCCASILLRWSCEQCTLQSVRRASIFFSLWLQKPATLWHTPLYLQQMFRPPFIFPGTGVIANLQQAKYS